MLSKICIVLAFISLCIYLYGVLISVSLPEKDDCRMTYMFEYPQFVKIHFRENEKFPRYNLYAYSEGHLTDAARHNKFNGAPVIFVHGNSGSYRQARSFGSVALRKGIENNWLNHLDYFAIDFNEEYSALFGGILDDQSLYLELCIKTVLNLYEDLPDPPTSVAIIGHSLGGKIAQSVLLSKEIAKRVNTVIALAAPLDQPVLNIDTYFEAFYRKVNSFWKKHRHIKYVITNTTNTCCNASNYLAGTAGNIRKDQDQTFMNFDGSSEEFEEESLESSEEHVESSENDTELGQIDTDHHSKHNDSNWLKDILLITIGGGSRDLLVQPGPTYSQYSDIHTMSTCIPNVWLTTDHLSAVWCLQQVIVINRYLYSIIQTNSRHKHETNRFIEDKSIRLAKAKYYFTQEIVEPPEHIEQILANNKNEIGDWVEDNRRVFVEKFKHGLDRTRIQMIRLHQSTSYQMLHLEAINIDTDDWVFGCRATEVTNSHRYCSRATSLTHYVQKLPSRRYNRKILKLDLHKIKRDHPDWTHVILRILPSKVPMQLNVDIHSFEQREIPFEMPSWYSYRRTILTNDTIFGATTYRISITGLDESYQALELNVKPICKKDKYHVVAKLCVPWTRGFERYHYFTDEEKDPMLITSPITKPSGYNTTLYPVMVELTLDPECRYRISLQNSFDMTTSRIVQQFSHWLPAHLVAILFLAFRHQIGLTPKKEQFKCGSLNSAYVNGSTFFIITASRLFVKMILWTKSFPDPDEFKHSLIISVIIHGSALALLNLLTYGLWFAIAVCGNVVHQFLFKLTQFPVSVSVVLPAIQKFPMTIGIVLISMAHASCGALPLILSVFVYFILIAKMYEDYLEEFVFKTAKLIAQKLFGRKESVSDEPTTDVKENGTTTIGQTEGEKPAITSGSSDKQGPSPLDVMALFEPIGEKPKEVEDAEKRGLARRRAKSKKADQNENTEDAVNKQLVQTDSAVASSSSNGSENSFELLYNQLDPQDIIDFDDQATIEDVDEEEDEEKKLLKKKSEEELDAELSKLMNEMIEKQKQLETAQKKEELTQRAEFDAIPDGLSTINFHLTLFLLLCVLCLLNLPSVIMWARNYGFGEKVLQNDPSYFPAIFALISLSFIWQVPTPRNVYGYEPLSSLCYLMAVISVIYCQDSIYRLSAIISSMFMIIALQQTFMPKVTTREDIIENNTATEDTDLMDRVRRLREDIVTSELERAPCETIPEVKGE